MPINPSIANILLDSCAFDPSDQYEQQASLEILALSDNGDLIVEIAHSTQKEINHPHTPDWVKQRAAQKIVTEEVQLSPNEMRIKNEILNIISGSGNPENYRADAEHVFEAQKYGSYFVTTDNGILRKKDALRDLCQIEILKPSQLLALLMTFNHGE